MKPLLDIHTHTVSSGHAYSTLEENVKQAAKKGLELLGITDHAPAMPGSAEEVYFTNFKAIPRNLEGVEIMMGVELNIMDYDGAVDLPERLLKKMDFTLASLHSLCIKPGSKKENTKAILNVMENPYVSIIGHPGDPKYPIEVEEVVLASKRTGTLLELNDSSLNPEGSRIGSDIFIEEILDYCLKHQVAAVMGTDAHFSTKVGDFSFLLKLLEKKHFPLELILNYDINRFKESLKKK